MLSNYLEIRREHRSEGVRFGHKKTDHDDSLCLWVSRSFGSQRVIHPKFAKNRAGFAIYSSADILIFPAKLPFALLAAWAGSRWPLKLISEYRCPRPCFKKWPLSKPKSPNIAGPLGGIAWVFILMFAKNYEAAVLKQAVLIFTFTLWSGFCMEE